MININDLPGTARVWVYVANRQLTPEETEQIIREGRKFISNWTAHRDKLKAAFEIVENAFVVLAVDEDEANASGCSIDKSVAFIRSIETEHDVSLLDWQTIVYRQQGELRFTSRSVFIKNVREGRIDNSSTVFDRSVQTLKEFRDNWEIPLSHSVYAPSAP